MECERPYNAVTELCSSKERCGVTMDNAAVAVGDMLWTSEYLGMHHDDLRSRRRSVSKSSDIGIDKGVHTPN